MNPARPWIPPGQDEVAALLETRRLPRRGRARLAMLAAPIAAVTIVFTGMVLAHVLLRGHDVPSGLVGAAATVMWATLVYCAVRFAATLPVPAWMTIGVGATSLAASALLWQAELLVSAAVPLAGAAILLGHAAAASIQRLLWTLPLFVAAAAGDLWSARAGATSEYRLLTGTGTAQASDGAIGLLAGPPAHALDVLFLHLPAVGTVWLVGAVDLAFASLLGAVAVRYRLPMLRTVVALVGPFAASTFVPAGVPLLPLLGGAFVLAHARLILAHIRFATQ